MAAVLALGPQAVLSHRSAVALWNLRASPVIEVTVPGDGGRRPRDGIAVHRSRTLGASDVTRHRGIPVTTPARTLLDYAEVVPRRLLERVLDEAEAALRLDWRTVDDVIERHPGRAGGRRLRAVIDRHDIGSTRSRSELEEAVLALCDRHDLPRPHLNARVAGMEVDCWWPDHRLVVEADSRRHHQTAYAFERDRMRDAALVAEGIRVIRLTHRRITEAETAVADLLRRVMAPAPSPARHRVAP
jgi:very-short-patch-repair endonuclease